MSYKEEISISEKKLRNKTVVSFTVFIVLLVGAVFLWKQLHKQPQEAGALKPLRTGLNYDGSFFLIF